MPTQTTDFDAEIKKRQAEIDELRQQRTRAEVAATEPDWLSAGGKYMVSLNAHGSGGAEVTTFRYNFPQSSGFLTAADLVSLRDHLTLVINMRAFS
ncbi:hypothetical protein [Cryobacterium sp. PH31-O1]|uniref:hypothetical protein n=1 Tax=Cryobacterium sp. PH31-O1 TaxID=3046306 RepID=UPI0024B8FAF4|nr:hypothetical protein [Cryobacterium sp. PH31-O1]MDJ0337417.1 hypothetical protein [Cryobacterium sp. PH31-O1]